jgi:translation elongation factor EF-1alpha
MDMFDWNEERFNYVKSQVQSFLTSINISEDSVYYIPMSGLKGTNLIYVDKEVPSLSWYKGLSLFEQIDKFEDPSRDSKFPVRFIVNDSGPSKIEFVQGFSLFGKVEGGSLTEGKEYLIMPHNLTVKTKGDI